MDEHSLHFLNIYFKPQVLQAMKNAPRPCLAQRKRKALPIKSGPMMRAILFAKSRTVGAPRGPY
jgi:hypothetical protein